ncbi:MAG: GNAT family N-acetyltransferase [Nitrosopumilus sp.]|nr:MAG: GNAT family N-acetyltransferase [Nitrosopumilus sp.]
MLLIQKTDDFAQVRDVRIKIFNEELGLSNSDIFDEDDKELDQFLIICDGVVIGSFRMRDMGNSHKIERMGISSKYRSKGFGKLSLDEIKSYSKNANKSKIILDSIYDVRNFYAKSGFVQFGNIYCKVGIPHVNMYFDM